MPEPIWKTGTMYATAVTGIDHADLVLLRRLLAAEADTGEDRMHAANLKCRLDSVRDTSGWRCLLAPAEPMVSCPWPGGEDAPAAGRTVGFGV